VGPVGTRPAIAHADTLYHRVGLSFFMALVERCYASVESDPILRPLYPFAIGQRERDAWVEHMTAAVQAGAAAPAGAEALLAYLRDASRMLVNRPA